MANLGGLRFLSGRENAQRSRYVDVSCRRKILTIVRNLPAIAFTPSRVCVLIVLTGCHGGSSCQCARHLA